MTYRIEGLDPAPFKALFALSDDALAARGARRMIATERPGCPCRVGLDDAAVGTALLLVNHVSHAVANAYRASHAIFVGEGASEPAQFVDSVPPALDRRMLSPRGFDADGMMVDALVVAPGEADAAIRKLFADPAIVAIHAHNAVRGCFAAYIDRA